MSNDVHIAKVSKIQSNRGESTYPTRQKGKDQRARRPDSPQDYTHTTNESSDNNIGSSSSTLDIKMVENITQQQLENQIRELTRRLQSCEEEKSETLRLLKECQSEKDLCLRRLEVVSTAHECRITEMHCVIAELSKKLRAKQEHTIVEEQEPDDSEISFQEGSVCNSELNLTNPDAECQTDPLESVEIYSGEDDIGIGLSKDHLSIDANNLDLAKELNENPYRVQVEALQEEVLHLRAHVALLQSEIANSVLIQSESKEHDFKIDETLDRCEDNLEDPLSDCSSERLHFIQSGIENKKAGPSAGGVTNEAAPNREVQGCDSVAAEVVTNQTVNVPKMAERVKLHCASKANNDTAPSFLHSEITNAEIVEHLVSDFKQNNSILGSFVEPAQLDNELQRLHRRIEHLKMQNTVLTLTLDECKEHCEHLYLLCGKYESNATALQLALNCSDRAIEAYDCLLALLETKLSLLKDENSIAAEESRKAVEAVARHLLDRLENEMEICENSFGPWQNNFSIPDKVSSVTWTKDDDSRLRNHVSRLKGRRSTVQSTIIQLESPFSDFYEKSRITAFESGSELKNQERNAHLDLEMAVLTQELLNLREENINLKLKTAELERERQYETDRVNILQEALNQLHSGAMDTTAYSAARNSLFIQTQNQQNVHGSDSISDSFENRSSYTEADHYALIEQQLVEALNRESELKSRIQKLISSIAATQKVIPAIMGVEDRDNTQQPTTNDVTKSNLNMTHLLEQNMKRKYQARIRKLEQKIMDMTLKSTTEELAPPMAAESACSEKVNVEEQCSLRNNNYTDFLNPMMQATTTAALLQQNNVPETTL